MEIKDIVALLDNSQDAETIALEIVSHEALSKCFCYWDRAKTTLCVPNYVMEWPNVNPLGVLIRELWDVAYNYGYADGFAEAEEGVI